MKWEHIQLQSYRKNRFCSIIKLRDSKIVQEIAVFFRIPEPELSVKSAGIPESARYLHRYMWTEYFQILAGQKFPKSAQNGIFDLFFSRKLLVPQKVLSK